MKNGFVGIGIAGCGSIGIRSALDHFKHGELNDVARITAVCDPAPGRAKAAAEKYKIPAWYESYEEMLGDANVDMVTLCSPIGLHYEQGMQAIKAGRHVHFNKTMTVETWESDDIISAAEKKGIHLVASPGVAYMPGVQRARRLILEGRLGKLSWAYADNVAGGGKFHTSEYMRVGDDPLSNVNPTWYFKKPAGGPQYDVAVYALHNITSILGPAKQVTAFSGKQYAYHEYKGEKIENEMDDSTTILIDYGEGFHVICNSVTADPMMAGELFCFPDIHGSEASIAKKRFGGEPLDHPGDHQPHVLGIHQELPERHVFEDIMQLVDLVRFGGKVDIGSPEQARHVVEIIEAGYRAARTGVVQRLKTTFEPLPISKLAAL
ncbi:MAG: Gfo/Idh/MocA family oxidoreductase [Clostridiales bacterium]|jgi:predicted dehydrogenase|nr:Gfo/Idh/MocA family oxidoreductase [Clostridiales bacterium]